MKIAFYCRIRGTGYGFLLPEDAEKLREFFTEDLDNVALARQKMQKICRILIFLCYNKSINLSRLNWQISFKFTVLAFSNAQKHSQAMR